METFVSDLSQKEYPITDQVSAKLVRKSILELICKDYPQFSMECKLAISELNVYRREYIAKFPGEGNRGAVGVGREVLGSMQNRQTLVDKVEETQDELTRGQQLADAVASFGGSWKFIISFGIFISF